MHITIPPAALEAGAKELCAREEWVIPWDELEEYDRDFYRDNARAAFEAMVAAWPGMKMTPYWEHMTHKRHVEMILPIAQENQ